MKEHKIKMTEEQFRRIVNEAVDNVVKEDVVDEFDMKKAAKGALGTAAAIGGMYGAAALDPGHGHPDAGADYNQPGYQEALYQQQNKQTDIPIDSLDWEKAKEIARSQMGESVHRAVNLTLREFIKEELNG